MTKLSTIISAVATALLMSSGAMAASLQPAAGEAPFFDEPVATSSTLTRAEVIAAAVANPPAAGEAAQSVEPTQTASTLTRAQVLAEAAANPPAAGEMNGWSVEGNASMVAQGQADVQEASAADATPGAARDAS